MSEYEFVNMEQDGPITLITINRPDVYNALHAPAHIEFDQVFDKFASDPKQWVAIITGAGDKAFSAGNDLKYQAAGGPRGRPANGFAGLTERFNLNKPIIAAVNGFAMGGGFEIALACDLIIASDNAIFALPEPRVGLAALAGGLHRLPRIIPQKQALGMILTGRRVTAAEGQQLGFVNEVTKPERLLDVARTWANQILECSPMSIRASKQSVYEGLRQPDLKNAMEEVYPAVQALYDSSDFVEGPKAFSEKRPPKWKAE